VPLQTLEHPEVQKAKIKYVLGFLCSSQLSCSGMDLAEKLIQNKDQEVFKV
jgi:hypothetical protein